MQRGGVGGREKPVMGEPQYELIVGAIAAHPGIKQGDLARLMGLKHQRIYTLILKLETRGVLLWEDDRGGLYLVDT